MVGSITPLPVMLDEQDRKRYAALEPPKTIVCRYGFMKLVAELPYDGDAKPGCGSKLVIRTSRGIELAEMLTTTCANSGCGKSVSRKQMLTYIEASGGKDYPFTNQGRVLRLAAVEDLNDQARIDSRKPEMMRFSRELSKEMDLPMKLVDVELLLGGERIIFHYTANQWVDFRDLVRRLASEYQTRIEMHQVNARDEARLVADYEKCGQQCCCKQFLKVLKPVSMRSAKVQKATLDPTKISGRCGRLMCCLRYEDQTYETLRKLLPHKQTRVMTDEGPGTVIDTQILTQLALVRHDSGAKNAAYPVENLQKLSKEEDEQLRLKAQEQAASAGAYKRGGDRRGGPGAGPDRRRADSQPKTAAPPTPGQVKENKPRPDAPAQAEGDKPRRRRRRRRNRGGGGSGNAGNPGGGGAPPAGGS